MLPGKCGELVLVERIEKSWNRLNPCDQILQVCADTEALFHRQRVRRFVNIERVARRKLEQLNQAGRLEDLRIPPGNRLEALREDRGGQYSIRINGQFRICFRWSEEGPEDVEIVDYH